MNFTFIFEKNVEITEPTSLIDGIEGSVGNENDMLEEGEADFGFHGNHLAISFIVFKQNLDKRFVQDLQFQPSLIGVAFSVISLYIIYKTPFLRNAFGYLCLIHTIGEGSVLLIFLLWSTPMSYIDSPLSENTIGRRMGDIVSVFYYITQYSQLLKAINRFIAISNPILYRRIFKDSNAKYLIVIVIGLSCINETIYLILHCEYFYDPYSLAWIFDEDACGESIPFYFDFVYGCSLVSSVIVIDACTWYSLYRHRRSFETTNNSNKKRELLFFLQTCVSSLLYSGMLLSFHLTWRLTDNPWLIYFSNTTAWELCHVFDGMLMVAFNFRYLSTSTKNKAQQKTFTIAAAASSVSRIPLNNNKNNIKRHS